MTGSSWKGPAMNGSNGLTIADMHYSLSNGKTEKQLFSIAKVEWLVVPDVFSCHSSSMPCQLSK